MLFSFHGCHGMGRCVGLIKATFDRADIAEALASAEGD